MKILDLFNEYNLSPEMTGGEMEQPRTEKDWNTMSRIYKAYIVSKDFGWIKRLVDNDKIDMDKARKNLKQIFVYEVSELYDDNKMIDITFSDDLLMQLSIQDEPLTFLISILK